MLDLDHWQEIWAGLSANKLRTVLTAFGIFWGIFLLMVMIGSGDGLAKGVEAGFAGTATNSLFLWTQRTSLPYRGLPKGRTFEMRNADAEAIRRQVPEADVVAPRNQLGGFRGGNNVTRGARAGAFSVMGDLPEIREIQSLRIDSGRFLNPIDLEERRKVAVIGTRVQEVLFAEGDEPIGDSVQINGVYFKVIGVFSSLQTGDQAERDTQTIYIPFTTFQHAFNFGDEVGWFAITSRPESNVAEVQEKVVALLKQRHRVAPEDDRAFGHFNLQEEYEKMLALFRGISILVWIVGTGTLVAGAIGVSNIMLVIVRERTREIGVRRAVGAKPSSIMGQIVLEAACLTALAGYLGLLAGIAVIELVATLTAGGGGMFQNPGVGLAEAFQALLILVVCGTLAGVIPAQRAVAISPVDALRAE